MDLSIVIPCLNEAETLSACILSARQGIELAGVTGEILIADNGSADGSRAIAERLDARVVSVASKGYGSALSGGIAAARGRWILMGDADDSYDFSEAPRFVERLRAGADLVMGCRMPGGGGRIEPGAMPWKNRWIGNPSLSLIGRLFFQPAIRDFHCGMRAFTRDAFDRMELKTTGMEFASEMVIKATIKQMRVEEVPVTLRKDGRSRPPHLRPWRDGWRHLRFMLIYSPRWLFLLPGLALALAGAVAAAALCGRPLHLQSITLDVGTLIVASMSILAGTQLVSFACFTKVFGIGEGLLPRDAKFENVFRFLTLERGILAGLASLLTGVTLLGYAIWQWKRAGFGDLEGGNHMRVLVLAATALVFGIQIISGSFFMSVLGLRMTDRNPAGKSSSVGILLK